MISKKLVYFANISSTFQPHNNILCPIQIEKVESFLSCPQLMTLPPKHIRPSEVEYTTLHSARRKTPGFYLITAEIASKLSKKTLLLLTHIYNSMLRLTYFPILWKFSVIVMIPKPNKPPDSPESYRPISLLPLFSKNSY